ncbi:MAG: hypothetical protein A3K07_01215 [Candidatus Doudnabacteria bacterium RIFCSPHIGHO2_01_43_10]|nr:MAG: hypothetical protein A3K07_01215 [Candidatus Doudnabacteria bacterium RIFCSPHIGHO2_01_43_10]
MDIYYIDFYEKNTQFKMQSKNKIIFGLITANLIASLFFIPTTNVAAQVPSANLSLTPSSGSFVVGSTFDVSIYLDTKDQIVNTIELNVKFPPDKLQMVSSSTGKSIIGIWTSLPKYNNQAGTIHLVGGVPGGIRVSRGLIATFTFRAKSVGSAIVKFDSSRVLLNDGFGTEILTQNFNSLYDLTLPPPSGPVVVSDTHPDQTQWYKETAASLKWEQEFGADGFSYVLNSTPVDVPDQISEGNKNNVVYRNLSEGRQYFHIRALRGGVWGGTTHFALNIDPTPPAEFPIEISPNSKTTRRQPVIQFNTTDVLSGLDHYEMRIVPLNKSPESTDNADELFFEVQSPYITTDLDLGKYDVLVRAYDLAGNYREQNERLEIVTAIFKYVNGEGLEFKSWLTVPWWLLLLLLLIILMLLLYIISKLHWWHRKLDDRRETKELPGNLQQQIEELQKYRQKYGKIIPVLLALIITFASGTVQAQESGLEVLGPPVISSVSKNISDEDIFYVGGQTGVASADVVIYLQSLETSATLSQTVKADKNGEWFYRHSGFLSPGSYLLWTQTKVGNQLSPPSPQIELLVETTAIKFGATRISYTSLYLTLFVLFALLSLLLLAYIIYKFIHGHRKHKMFMKEITEAEASVRRGFAVLNRDIQAELEIIKSAKMSKDLSKEEQKKEEQLLKDLGEIEQYLSKEIWDIEEVERGRS